MHPVWEKIADFVEKDFERERPKIIKEQSIRRVGFWIALGIGFLLTIVYEVGVIRQWQASDEPPTGSYCPYP